MTLFTINLFSKCLHKQTEVNLLVPSNANATSCLKTIWLLHGMTDDHTGWLRKSNIETLAEKYGVCVVMPNADLSFYVNMAYGADYFDYISSELPAFLMNFFPISNRMEDNYISGVSMGGYGAFHIAMNCPGKYISAASFSGPMNISWIYSILSNEDLFFQAQESKHENANNIDSFSIKNKSIPRMLIDSLTKSEDLCTTRIFKGMFGIDASLTQNKYDIYSLADNLVKCDKPPKLYAYCGTEDYHYKSNVDFSKYASSIGLNYSLETGTGEHTWQYWNIKIPNMMEHFFKENVCT